MKQRTYLGQRAETEEHTLPHGRRISVLHRIGGTTEIRVLKGDGRNGTLEIFESHTLPAGHEHRTDDLVQQIKAAW